MKLLTGLIALTLMSSAYAEDTFPQKQAQVTFDLSHYVMGVGGEVNLKKQTVLSKMNRAVGNTASDSTGLGFLGSSLSGINPFSAKGVGISSTISTVFTLFSAAKAAVTEPTYRPKDIQGDFFGKYYLAETADSEKDAINKMNADIYAAVKDSAKKNLGMNAYCLPNGIDCKEYSRHGQKMVIYKLSEEELTSDEIPKFKPYALFVSHGDMVMSSIQQDRDALLGFTPSYETKAEEGFRLAVHFTDEATKKSVQNDPDILKDPKWNLFLAEVAKSNGVLFMTPNLKTFYHNNHVFNQDQLIEAHNNAVNQVEVQQPAETQQPVVTNENQEMISPENQVHSSNGYFTGKFLVADNSVVPAIPERMTEEQINALIEKKQNPNSISTEELKNLPVAKIPTDQIVKLYKDNYITYEEAINFGATPQDLN